MEFLIIASRCGGESESFLLRGFPALIGRDPACKLVSHGAGVFSKHAELRRAVDGAVEIFAVGEALVFVGEEPVRQRRLRNGDRFRCGSEEFQFYLAPARQRGLGWRETVFWTAAAVVALLQLIILAKLG